MAWAQHTGIAKVEVRVDDDEWRTQSWPRSPGRTPGGNGASIWDAEPGPHEVTVRAVDADGEVQTDAAAPPAPDGATGWHQIAVRVREA